MSNPCIVCGGSRITPLYSGILTCSDCGYVFADLALADEEFVRLYQHNYFHDGEYSDYCSDEQILRKNFKLRLKVLTKYLEPVRHKHLLEIGSAYGFFLDTAKDDFETVEGMDITAEGVQHAQQALGLDVRETDFLEYDTSGRLWDVVCLWDTIEHLSRPDRYLEKVGKHTQPGALLAITTGDIESLTARIRKRHWRLIHPPTHAHYFSQKTLARLLDRHGFDVIYSRHCGFYRSIDQVAYSIIVGKWKMIGLYELLKKTRITEMSFYLNLFDISYVIARKRC